MAPRNPKIVYAVNRTDQPLDCMDDGIPIVVRPGYKRVPLMVEGKPVTETVKDPETGQRVERQVTEIVGAGPNGDVLMEPLPYYTAERCRRQHPLMGSQDPYNPGDTEYLIAIPEWNQEYGYLAQSDVPELLNRTLMESSAQKATLITPRGGRKPPKPGKSGARRSPEYIDDRMTQPVTFGR